MSTKCPAETRKCDIDGSESCYQSTCGLAKIPGAKFCKRHAKLENSKEILEPYFPAKTTTNEHEFHHLLEDNHSFFKELFTKYANLKRAYDKEAEELETELVIKNEEIQSLERKIAELEEKIRIAQSGNTISKELQRQKLEELTSDIETLVETKENLITETEALIITLSDCREKGDAMFRLATASYDDLQTKGKRKRFEVDDGDDVSMKVAR